MTEREIRKQMEDQGLSDLWWSFSNGERAATPTSLLGIIEAFEGKVPSVKILHDSQKDQPNAAWLSLDFAAPVATPQPRPPVSTPKEAAPQPPDSAKSPAPAQGADGDESEVWLGNPSQWLNAKTFGICGFIAIAGLIVLILYWSSLRGLPGWVQFLYALIVFLIPGGVSLWKWLETRNYKYELTDQRLKTHEGVLNKKTDTLELYRVKDTEIARPFWLRLIGRGNIILHTSDRTTPTLVLQAIAKPAEQVELIRAKVEKLRESKRVREMDFSGDGEFE